MARARASGGTATTRARKARVVKGAPEAASTETTDGQAEVLTPEPEVGGMDRAIGEEGSRPALAVVRRGEVGAEDPKTAALVKEAGYQKLVEECQKQFAGVIERYWNIGKRIDAFLSRDENEKTYGRRLFHRLSVDSGVATSALYDAHRFYKADPEKSLIERLTTVAWGKTRRLLPLLDAPAAREAVLDDLLMIQDMPPDVFTREWIPQAYEKHLGKAPRGRKPGQKTDSAGPLGRAMKILEGMAAKGKLEPVVKELNNSEGFIAVIGWDGIDDRNAITNLLEQLLARLRA